VETNGRPCDVTRFSYELTSLPVAEIMWNWLAVFRRACPRFCLTRSRHPLCDQHKFVFEIDRAIRTQVIEKLEASPKHSLSEDVAPPEKGVYVLYWKNKLVYAGKALNTTLKRRLAEHTRKVASRKNISLDQLSCRFLVIESDWFVRAAEDALIVGYNPLWNKSGFGSHVPGRGRPGIKQPKWDKEYPPK